MQKVSAALLGLCFLGFSAPVQASSPSAWGDLRARSDRACLRTASSTVLAGRISAYSADFEQVTVSTVVGASRARANRGAAIKLTCVYDKRSNRAQAFELQAPR